MNSEQLKSKLNSRFEYITQEKENKTMSDISETSLKSNQEYVALAGNTIDIIKQNLKNQPLSLQLFDTVKAPSGGATVFTVPGISGDEAEKSITGIILDYTTPRAYWETSDPVEGTPPACYSKDSIISFDGKACCSCPYNTYGSKDGESNAKACKESVSLFMLRPGNIMPIIVRIPVSSKVIFQRYLTRLISKMIPISSVITKITLSKTTNKSGQPYSIYNFEAASVLPPNEASKANDFSKSFMEIMASNDTCINNKAAG